MAEDKQPRPTDATADDDSDALARRRQARRARRTIARWVKRVALIVVALGLCAALVYAFLPRPVPVDLAVARSGPMEVTIDEDGKTRVEDRYVVLAPLTGNMPRLALEPGDSVAEGEVLTRIVPSAAPLLDARTRAEARARLAAAQAAQRQAAAQVERARAGYEQARRDAERQAPLAASGAVSEATAERSALEARARAEELRSAEFGVKVAMQEVASARAALGLLEGRAPAGDEPHLEIRSPVSGQVLRVLREDAGLVQAGTPLVELGDPASLEIVVDVLTRDAVQIGQRAPVEIMRWGGDHVLTGHVQRIEPSAFTRVSALGVEEQRVNVIIALDDPRERWVELGDGYRVEVAIEVWRDEDVLQVPASAVFRRGDEWAVFRASGEVAGLVAVDVGRRNQRQVQIERGLEAGDAVITHPSDRVTDGADITARR